MSRARGEFPDQVEDALIKLRFLERAPQGARRVSRFLTVEAS